MQGATGVGDEVAEQAEAGVAADHREGVHHHQPSGEQIACGKAGDLLTQQPAQLTLVARRAAPGSVTTLGAPARPSSSTVMVIAG
jgi:hypothetical protein